jgi:transposase
VPVPATFALFDQTPVECVIETGGPVAERVGVRKITNEEGNRLLRILRRSSGSVVTWRRAQMILLSAQGMPVPGIAEVTFTSTDRVRDVIHNFNLDGFDALYPRYRGGRPPTFTLAQRREIQKLALSRPQDHDLPFSTWSLSKLADFLVAEGVVDDISHEGLRVLLREEGVSFQRLKTWKTSRDPDYEPKKNRILRWLVVAAYRRGAGGGRPTRDLMGCATCWLPTTCRGTGCTGISSPASAVVSSWCSCAMCVACTRPGCGSRSWWTTTRRTCRLPLTGGWVGGLWPTTSSWPIRRPTPAT